MDALLFIGGVAVDLSESSLVQMTFRHEDYTNPAIVRNSYSQSVTLPDTPTNNKLFGGMWRSDRAASNSFKPLSRTPFVLYDKMGLVVESGYCRLDKVTRVGTRVEYSVTLYGGLGSFLYGLTYNEDGTKRTLASLDWGEDISFVMSKEAVRDAWADLSNGTQSKWQKINFVPTYGGNADDFDRNKVLVDVAGASSLYSRNIIPPSIPTADGKVLVEMAKEMNEWQMADLRCYLQRPAFRVKELFAALQRDALANGITLDLDDKFFRSANPYYEDAWITLPLVGNFEGAEKATGRLLVFPDDTYSGTGSAILTLSEGFDVRQKSTATIALTLRNGVPYSFYNKHTHIDANTRHTEWSGMFMQVIALDENGNEVGYSKVINLSSGGAPSPLAVEYSGWSPKGGAEVVHSWGWFENDSEGRPTWTQPLLFEVSGYGVKSYRVEMQGWWLVDGRELDPWGFNSYYAYGGKSDEVTINSQVATLTLADGGSYFEASNDYLLRNGQLVTGASLLGGTSTPADYLLSFCKMFGLFVVKDKIENKVSILRRDTFFTQRVVDLSQRVDLSQSMDITPIAAPARWLSFAAESGGGLAEAYKKEHGSEYGSLTINTGYDFDSNTTNIAEGVLFRGGIMTTDAGEDYSTPKNANGQPLVNWEAYGYTITDANGEQTEVAPTRVFSRDYWSAYGPYDYAPKMQLESDGKGIDGENILIFHLPSDTYAGGNPFGYWVSEDTPQMLEMNEGKACWLLSSLDNDCVSVTPPFFSRYLPSVEDNTIADKTLDYGTPLEVFDKHLRGFAGLSNIGEQYWGTFLADRYGENTRLVSCKVILDGMQVSGEMLRDFYYFDGALWCLLAIENYAPSKGVASACSFVQVGSASAYEVRAHRAILEVSPLSVIIPAAATSITLTITSTERWRIISGADFVSIDEPSGGVWDEYATEQRPLDITANTTTDVRRCVVVVRSESGKELRVNIRQGSAAIAHEINEPQCIRCGMCLSACPTGAITRSENGVYSVASGCINCGMCAEVCPSDAIWVII